MTNISRYAPQRNRLGRIEAKIEYLQSSFSFDKHNASKYPSAMAVDIYFTALTKINNFVYMG